MPDGSAAAEPALAAAEAAVRSACPDQPLVGLILGSGLGELAAQVEQPRVLPFAAIPNHPLPAVAGHAGELVIGRLEGVPVAVWRGRAHFYEGYSMPEVAFPVRLLSRLGGRAILITNAAGGLNEAFRPGELMLLTDHINLPGLAGHNPLRGPHPPSAGARFVDLAAAYDPSLRSLASNVARRLGCELRQGVYVMVAGPNYETPAEGRLLRALGADAVGMSTVPEVLAARELGLRVLALSVITNAVLSETGTDHQEVLAAAEQAKSRFSALVRGIVAGMPQVLER